MSSKYCVLALLAAAVLANPASAYIINTTTDTPLFYDGFEEQPVDKVSHAAYSTTDTLNALPASTPLYGGSWMMLNFPDTGGNAYYRQLQVTDYVSGTAAPGAYEGDNYLRSHRQSSGENWFHARQIFNRQTTAGSLVHYEQMVYIPTTSSTYSFAVGLGDSADGTTFTSLLGNLYAGSNGNVGAHTNGTTGGVTLANAKWTANKWQKWEIDYVIGATSFSVTIDGVTDTGISVQKGIGGSLSYVYFFIGNNSSPTAYIDETFAVPEPSTLALLACGLVGLLAYAWRKRR